MLPATKLTRSILVLLTLLVATRVGAQPAPGLPRIAHAGGQIEGATYTNSLEALDANYAEGFRAFEIDFSWTSDQQLVCLHDWEESFERSFGLPATVPVTRQVFEQLVNEHSPFTKCTLASFMDWFSDHPDAVLITDVKERNVGALTHISTNYPQHLARIIPQIYQPDEYQPVTELGYEKLIWTLYIYPGGTLAVLENLPDMELWAVTMNTDRAQQNLPRELANFGIPTYAHTINNYADFLYLKSLGIDEIYTDGLSLGRERDLNDTSGLSLADSPLYKANEARKGDLAQRIELFFDLPTTHYSLAEDFDRASVTSNQITNLNLTAGRLEIAASGNDPYINFPSLENPASEIGIYIELDVPDSTVVEIFYTTQSNPAFSATHRTSERVAAGENRLVIDLNESSPITRVRLDPGTVAGDYLVKQFEIRSRSPSRSLLRFFRRWNR